MEENKRIGNTTTVYPDKGIYKIITYRNAKGWKQKLAEQLKKRIWGGKVKSVLIFSEILPVKLEIPTQIS